MSTKTNNKTKPTTWPNLRKQVRAMFSMANLYPPEVEGHFAAKLTDAEMAQIKRFATRKTRRGAERQSTILLLRQNRTALEYLAQNAPVPPAKKKARKSA